MSRHNFNYGDRVKIIGSTTSDGQRLAAMPALYIISKPGPAKMEDSLSVGPKFGNLDDMHNGRDYMTFELYKIFPADPLTTKELKAQIADAAKKLRDEFEETKKYASAAAEAQKEYERLEKEKEEKTGKLNAVSKRMVKLVSSSLHVKHYSREYSAMLAVLSALCGEDLKPHVNLD